MAVSQLEVVDGPVIAYDDTAGDGPVMILSHGLFMDRTMFGPQVDHFRSRFRCITWDERGHGETVWAGGAFTYWDSARDLLALMDALGIDRAVHVGMSQGGLLGMRAALLAPERFHGTVMLSTQAGQLAEEGAAAFKAIVDEWIEAGATEDKLTFLTDLILGPGVDPTYWRAAWSRLSPQQLTDATGALYSLEEIYDRLPEVTVPLMVIHGLADVSTPWQRARRVALEVADCRGLTLVPGGPHAVNLSQPEVVNAALDTFVDSVLGEHAVPLADARIVP